jgi:hypothetical protein
MLSNVYHWIIYFIIPGIMITILVVGIFLSQRVPSRYRVSARAGLGAGVVAFIIYIAASFSSLKAVPPNASTLPTFHWVAFIVGLAIGFSNSGLVLSLYCRDHLYSRIQLVFRVAQPRFYNLLCLECAPRNTSIYHLLLREGGCKGNIGAAKEPVGLSLRA